MMALRSMKDCPKYTMSKAVLSGEVYWRCAGGQKGGFAVAEKAVIGLDLILGLTPKEVWTGTYSWPASWLRSLVG